MGEFAKAIMNGNKSVMKSLQLTFFFHAMLSLHYLKFRSLVIFLLHLYSFYISYKLRTIIGFETSEIGLWNYMKESWMRQLCSG